MSDDKKYSEELVEAAVQANLHAYSYSALKHIHDLLFEFGKGVKFSIENDVPLPVDLVQETFDDLFVGINHVKEFAKLMMENKKTIMDEFKRENGIPKLDLEAPEFAGLKALLLADSRIERMTEFLKESVPEAKNRIISEQASNGAVKLEDFLRKLMEQDSNDPSAN